MSTEEKTKLEKMKLDQLITTLRKAEQFQHTCIRSLDRAKQDAVDAGKNIAEIEAEIAKIIKLELRGVASIIAEDKS